MERTNITLFRLTPADLKQMLGLQDDSMLVSITLVEGKKGDREIEVVFNKMVE